MQRNILSCGHFIQNSFYLWLFHTYIHTSIHTYIHACIHAHVLIVWTFSRRYVYMQFTLYIYIHVFVVLIFKFSRIHIPEAEVLSVRFPKEYDQINLAAKHPKLCTYFIQNYVYCDFSIHPYIHTCMHTRTCIDRLHFFQGYVCIIYIHTCVHRVLFWFILMPSRKHFQAAEVLGVWFPKEYLAAKHIFHSKLCSLPYIHTYMHAYTHTFIDSLILFKDIYFDIQYSGVYQCYTSRGSKCLIPQGIRPH